MSREIAVLKKKHSKMTLGRTLNRVGVGRGQSFAWGTALGLGSVMLIPFTNTAAEVEVVDRAPRAVEQQFCAEESSTKNIDTVAIIAFDEPGYWKVDCIGEDGKSFAKREVHYSAIVPLPNNSVVDHLAG